MQRATTSIKHMEKYTNITVTKIMLVSINMFGPTSVKIHSGLSNAVLFDEAIK